MSTFIIYILVHNAYRYIYIYYGLTHARVLKYLCSMPNPSALPPYLAAHEHARQEGDEDDAVGHEPRHEAGVVLEH